MPFPSMFILYIDVNYIIADTEEFCQGKDVQGVRFIFLHGGGKPPPWGYHFSSTLVPGAGVIGRCTWLPIDGGTTNSPERGFNHST